MTTGNLVKAALERGPDGARRTRQRARFLAEARGARASVWRDISIGLIAAGLSSLVVFAMWQLKGGDGLETPRSEGSALVFNEASRIELTAGTRAHVERAFGHEAVVVLESGSLSCSITTGLKNVWRFRAGPHEAIVRGTKFVLSWNPVTDDFGLTVSEGKVEVHRGGRVEYVTPAQGLSPLARAEPEKVMQLDELALDELPVDELAPTRAPTSKRGEKRVSAIKPLEAPPEFIEPDDKRPLVPEWKRQAEAGRYAKAVALVEEQGVQAALVGASSDDLLLFADAARLARHAPLSRVALTAVRDRFAKTADAAEAAFRLGRMEFDAHQLVEAGDWFDTYVREAPSGAFISEAMGRRLDAWQHAPDPRVKTAASEYLEKYPKGAYARLARQVLEGQ